MADDGFERIEFWTTKEPPTVGALTNAELPFLSVGIDDEHGPSVEFYAFPEEGHNGGAEWIFRQPLRDLLQYWLEMHEGADGIDLDHPEARLLTKLLVAYDEWLAAEKQRGA